MNEKSVDRDFYLCLPGMFQSPTHYETRLTCAKLSASGDLRNIIMTINSLPLDFSHQLTIVLNDRERYIVVRNILLLLILGSTLDTTDAANVALHAWYSAFIPGEHLLEIQLLVTDLVTEVNGESGKFSRALGQGCKLSGEVNSDIFKLLVAMMTSEYDIEDTNRELKRVRCVQNLGSEYKHRGIDIQ